MFFSFWVSLLAAHHLNAADSLYQHGSNWNSDYKKFIQSSLEEHKRLTGESVVFWFEKQSNKPLSAFAKEVYLQIKPTLLKPANSLVVVLDVATGKWGVFVGIGIDPEMTTWIEKQHKTHFLTDFKQGNFDRGLILWVREILKNLESPLIANDKFDEDLKNLGWSTGFLPASEKSRYNYWWFVFLWAVIFIALTIYSVVKAEIHYSVLGWFRFPLYKRVKVYWDLKRGKTKHTILSGGGVYGRW